MNRSLIRCLISTSLLAAGCSASGNAPNGGSGGASGGAGGSLSGGSGGIGAVSGSGGLGAVGGACQGQRCSADLHSLVDCDGNVLKACPPDQGCAGSDCVKACDSAKANRSTFGCDYYTQPPAILPDGRGACFAAYVVNTWSTPVNILVDFKGALIDLSKFAYIPAGAGSSIVYTKLTNGQIPAGQVAILFLDRHPGAFQPGLNFNCPPGITTAINTAEATVLGTGLTSSFHITSSAPIVAYDMYPFGGGGSALTSATLLLPTSAWDTNYVSVDARGPNPLGIGPNPAFQIVAQADATSITINPSADLKGGTGVAATAKFTQGTYTLNRGQVMQVAQGPSLAGSIISSTAPVGLFAGQTAMGIEACCDDSAHQMIPPVRAMGSEYVAVRYRNRFDGIEEDPPWRLTGLVRGTILTYEPAPPTGAPATLDLGEVKEFKAPGPFTVRSQDQDHPFYIAAYMTGAGLYDPQVIDPNAKMDGRGDAEYVNIVAAGEYLDKYVFFTDPTYPETDLVVVRTKGKNGFEEVNLDCAGDLTGWQPVGTAGAYEYTRFDLVRHNFAPQQGCTNGRHEMTSKLPFGVTVWGWGSAETGGGIGQGFQTQYVSYAYPAGQGVKPINEVIVQPVR